MEHFKDRDLMMPESVAVPSCDETSISAVDVSVSLKLSASGPFTSSEAFSTAISMLRCACYGGV